jgi:predicted dehydrogenase
MPNTRQSAGVSRRQFVRGAAAISAAAAAGFPTIIPSSALGNAGRAAPSERLNLAFIGVGKQGWGSHLNRLSGRRDTQIVGICDVYGLRREQAAKKVNDTYAKLERKDYKGCPTFTKYQDILANAGADAVLIATPDHWHTAIAIEACKAKKDIYCEKPLTLTIAEAKALIDCVRKYDVVFQVGSQQRSEGPFREVAEYIRNGRLGNLKEIHVALGGTSSKPCDLPAQEKPEALDWEQWLGQAPQRPYNEVLCRKGLPDSYPFNPGWRDYREFSGGYVTDWGAHHFDIVQWALDKDNSGPVEIRPPANKDDAYGTTFIYRDTPAGKEVPVTHMKNIASPDGRQENNGILFVGEKGSIFVNRGKKVSKPESILAEPIGPNDVHLFKSPGHHENWYQCIKSRQRPLCDVEIGSRSVTVCHLVNLAYWNDERLQWDPQKWEFTGSNADEANKWRSRERRAGYELPTF